jgi:hypothetical protein
MSIAPPTSRLGPACVYLLAEHLDAALAAGEDLRSVRFNWTAPPPRSREEIEEIRAGQRAAIERIRTYELALLSRLLIGREWAVTVALEESKFSTMARLYVVGTAVLVDAVDECGDTTAIDFDTGDDLLAYVRSRGLIAKDAAALADMSPIAPDESFLVAKRVELGVLLDLAAAFLDALEADFDLFTDETIDGERIKLLPPAAELLPS